MADADLLGAAELGDHDALLKALADGANVNATDPKDAGLSAGAKRRQRQREAKAQAP